MNQILDIFHTESTPASTQEPSPNPPPNNSYQGSNIPTTNFNLTSHAQTDSGFCKGDLTSEAARQLIIQQLGGLQSFQQYNPFDQTGFFNVSAGKRSPPQTKDALMAINDHCEKNIFSEKPQVNKIQSQFIETSKSRSHTLTHFNQLFKNYPKQTRTQVRSTALDKEKEMNELKNTKFFQKQRADEARNFIKHIKAKRNYFKARQTKFRIYTNNKNLRRNFIIDRVRDTLFRSESINETVPNLFEEKNRRDQEKNKSLQAQQLVSEQVITSSQPSIQQPQQQNLSQQSFQQQDLSLQCNEVPILPSSEEESHLSIRQEVHEPSLIIANSRNLSQDSGRSQESNNSSEEGQLFRIFSSLRVLTVYNNQQQPTTTGTQERQRQLSLPSLNRGQI